MDISPCNYVLLFANSNCLQCSQRCQCQVCNGWNVVNIYCSCICCSSDYCNPGRSCSCSSVGNLLLRLSRTDGRGTSRNNCCKPACSTCGSATGTGFEDHGLVHVSSSCNSLQPQRVWWQRLPAEMLRPLGSILRHPGMNHSLKDGNGKCLL